MQLRFAHTLLFYCPRCNADILANSFSEDRNLEQVDGESVLAICESCGERFELPVIEAKKHCVESWDASLFRQVLLKM
jgi:transcription elongation factor Elf1